MWKICFPSRLDSADDDDDDFDRDFDLAVMNPGGGLNAAGRFVVVF
jgi:hypothetical protein